MANKNLPPILIPDGEPIPERENDPEVIREPTLFERVIESTPIPTPVRGQGPRYRMTNYRRNVRVDLSEREIRVPRERNRNQGFREVHGGGATIQADLRAVREQNMDIWRIGFMITAIAAVTFMVFSIVLGIQDSDNTFTVVGAAICSISALVFSLLTNGIRSWHTWMWIFNGTLWTIQACML